MIPLLFSFQNQLALVEANFNHRTAMLEGKQDNAAAVNAAVKQALEMESTK